MCIRDRVLPEPLSAGSPWPRRARKRPRPRPDDAADHDSHGCLLYTSDAADERSSVDLGGRRIIKKKIAEKTHRHIKY